MNYPDELDGAGVEQLTELAARYAALAEVPRLRILQTLMTGEQSVGQLTKTLGMAQPTTSHHLNILHMAGLVKRRKDRRWRYYRLAHHEQALREESSGTAGGSTFGEPSHPPGLKAAAVVN